eukprot:gene7374-11696_t
MWKRIQTDEDEVRKLSLHSSVIYKSKLYIFGGYFDRLNQTFDDFFEFDLFTKTWKKIESNQPTDRMGHCSIVWNDELYMFGGWHPNFSKSFLTDIQKYNFKKNKWSEVKYKTKLENINRCYHSGNLYNNSFYIFGGWNGFKRLNELLLYTLETNNLKLVSIATGDVPCGRSGHSSTIFDDYLFIFGGFNQNSDRMNDLFMYDIMKKHWKKINFENNSLIPKCSSGHKLIFHKDKLFLFGGSYGGDNQYFRSHEMNYLNDLWNFDLITFKWSKMIDENNLVCGRSFFSLDIFQNSLILFGGSCKEGNLNDVFNYILNFDFGEIIFKEKIYETYSDIIIKF